MKISTFIGTALVSALLLSATGCVSLDKFDEWHSGEYEAEKRELERFEQLRSEYAHIVEFSTPSDRNFIQEVDSRGQVENGLYSFANDTDREFTHFRLDLEALREQKGKRLERIALLLRPRNCNQGFIEIWPGQNLEGDGGNPVSGEHGALNNNAWNFIEFLIVDGKTKVQVSSFNKTLPKPVDNISVFCFNGSAVDIDYILFE